MTNILQITSDGARLCDEYGDRSCSALSFSLGQQLNLIFDLRGDAAGSSGKLTPYAGTEPDESVEFYFAIGTGEWENGASPLLLRTGEIAFSRSSSGAFLEIDIPDTGTAALAAALSGKANNVFCAEIGALDDNGKALAVWQFEVTVNNRIYLGGDAPESVSGDPAYLTAAEVLAVIAGRMAEFEISAGTGISVSGNTVSADLTAGSGIAISGNTISSALSFGDGFSVSAGTVGLQICGEAGISVSDDGNGAYVVAQALCPTAGIYLVDGEIGVCTGDGLQIVDYGDDDIRLAVDFADDSEVVDGLETAKCISCATLKTELDRRLASVVQSTVAAINYDPDVIVTGGGTAAEIFLCGGTHYRFSHALAFLEINFAGGIAGRLGSAIFTMAQTSSYSQIFWCDPAFSIAGTLPTIVCGASYIATVLDGVLKIEEVTLGSN